MFFSTNETSEKICKSTFNNTIIFHFWVINFNNYLYGLVHILFVFSKIEKQLTKCLIGTLTNTEYISENPREIYVAQLAMAAFSSVRLPHNISICNTNDRATESQTASAEKKPHTLGSVEHI